MPQGAGNKVAQPTEWLQVTVNCLGTSNALRCLSPNEIIKGDALNIRYNTKAGSFDNGLKDFFKKKRDDSISIINYSARVPIKSNTVSNAQVILDISIVCCNISQTSRILNI